MTILAVAVCAGILWMWASDSIKHDAYIKGKIEGYIEARTDLAKSYQADHLMDDQTVGVVVDFSKRKDILQ